MSGSMETKLEPTRREILEAGRLLSGVCDGAVALDGQGFNAFDAPTAKSIIGTGSPSDRQIRSLWHILRKYRKQLSGFGVEYDSLVPPEPAPRAQAASETNGVSKVRMQWVGTEYGRRIALAFPYEVRLVSAAKGLKLRWFDKEGKNDAGIKNAWLIPDDADDFDGALGVFEALEPRVEMEVEPALKAAMDAVREERRLRYRESRSESADIEVPTKLPLRPFQKAGVKWIEETGLALVADEMGIGKTVQSLGYLALHPEALPALVVASATLRINWYREVSRFTDLKPVVLTSKTSIRAFQKLGVNAALAPEPGHDLYIMNYDLLETETPQIWVKMLVKGDESCVPYLIEAGQYAMKPLNRAYAKVGDMALKKKILEIIKEIGAQGKDSNRKRFVKAFVNGTALEAFLSIGFKSLILDEIHYIKEASAQRTMAVHEMAKRVPVRIGLTGTPLLQRPMELWSQVYAINPEIFPNYVKFGIEFCNGFQKQAGRQMVWDFSGASNLDKLERVLRSTVMIRRTKEQVLKELPPKTRITVPLMVEDGLAEYKKHEKPALEKLLGIRREWDEWRKRLDSLSREERAKYIIDHAEEASKKNRLSKVAVEEIEKLKQKAVAAKFDQCLKFVLNAQEQQGKVLVFMVHHESIDRMVEGLGKAGKKVDRIDGRVDGAKRDPIKDRFQEGDLEILVCGIRAASEGLTLTASHTVIFVEFDWNPSRHDQAEARVDRFGQKVPPTVYYLMALATIEEKIVKLIDAKREVVNAALGEGERTVSEEGILDAILDGVLEGVKE